jgi:hypothetical protein
MGINKGRKRALYDIFVAFYVMRESFAPSCPFEGDIPAVSETHALRVSF